MKRPSELIADVARDLLGEKRRGGVAVVNGRIRPLSVFVPWETLTDGRTIRCTNLPRFAAIEQARDFVFLNNDLARRRISYVEDFSELAKDELLAGYGSGR